MVTWTVEEVVGRERLVGRVEPHHRMFDLCRCGRVSGMERRQQGGAAQ
jgi:hypothetical protein